MPKITDDDRLRRRQVFLDAAWRCFSRQGVGPTTLDDITREAGRSAGSMYIYFRTKDDLIRSAITASLERFEALSADVAASGAGRSPDAFVEELLSRTERFRLRQDGVDLFRLAVQGWAHAQVDGASAGILAESYDRLRAEWAGLAAKWIATGAVTKDATADEIAECIGALVLGFVAQHVLVGTSAERQLHAWNALVHAGSPAVEAANALP
jgi:AcrR family transcriptional regulator